jgi:hypothetical protein
VRAQVQVKILVRIAGIADTFQFYLPMDFRLPQLNSMAREYLRDLSAAEMIAWQLSGGDYLISGFKLQKS